MNTVELDRIEPPAEIVLSTQDEEFCRLRVEHGWGSSICYDLSHPSQHGQARSELALNTRGCELMKKPGIKEKIQKLKDDSDSLFTLSYTEKRIKLAHFARGGVEQIMDENGQIDVEKLRHLPTGAIAKLKSTATTRRVKVPGGQEDEYEDVTTVTTEIQLRDPLKAIDIDNRMVGDYADETVNHNLVPLESEIDKANNKAKQLPSPDEAN